MRFKDKSVIITGGGGKIAKAYALAFAKEGAKLSLPDIASAEAIVKAIKDLGGTAISMACDVADKQSVKAITEGRQVDPKYEKIRARQRSLKRTQVENDLVGTVLYLCSSESNFMTGQLLNVDGGFHFVG
jgi:NAD(P)-dependent dehydrogenase (short-subunit alcohol dehydrogenase family)